MYACMYHVHAHICVRPCTWWIKLQSPLLNLHCTRRCSWTWHSAARSMLSSPIMLVWGRWLKFAAFVLVQKQCVIWSFCRNRRWFCLCATRVALWKKLLRVSQRRKTASSIVQFECVPEKLIVWLTCQRSYPTSHSRTLNSSDPGLTFRSLTVVRNISFSLSSLHHVQHAI